jgi:hypothetical protein
LVDTGPKLRIIDALDEDMGADGGESGVFVRSIISIGIFA